MRHIQHYPAGQVDTNCSILLLVLAVEKEKKKKEKKKKKPRVLKNALFAGIGMARRLALPTLIRFLFSTL